jgi:flagellum-specific peptidoglycan hydrolase FlgJ
VDPRFSLVVPKGKATTWNQMGSGNWATDPAYATKILALYAEARSFSGVR